MFLIVSDPVGSGFVTSLASPGGNITGIVNIELSLGGKWIEVLREIAPGMTRAALMFNPDTAPYSRFYLEPFEAAARSRGVEPIAAPVRTGGDIERVIAGLAERSDAALAAMPDVALSTQSNRDLIIPLVARRRLLTTIHTGTGSATADSFPMGLIRSICIGVCRSISIAFSRVQSLPNFQCSCLPGSNWPSISGPQRHSG